MTEIMKKKKKDVKNKRRWKWTRDTRFERGKRKRGQREAQRFRRMTGNEKWG